MAPKAKPDPELLAQLKELRQAAQLERKLKQLERMRKEAPLRPNPPTQKPKGKGKRTVR